MYKRACIIFVAMFLPFSGLLAQGSPILSAGAPLATVKLTKTEIITDKAYRADIERLEKGLGRVLTAEEKKLYLDTKINDILFTQMCERDGIKVLDSEVDGMIAQIRAQQRPAGETDQQFSAWLMSQGATYAELRAEYKKQILIQRWITSAKATEIAAIPRVTSDEIIKTYDLYKAKLIRPDSVKIGFLFYQILPNDASTKTKGASVIKDLSAKLNKGESFDSLRLKAAEDGYASNREPVYFERGEVFLSQFGQKFYDMVFSLKDGAVSIPFETEAGWWIIKRFEFVPQKQLELSDPYRLGQQGTVQDYIAQLLTQQREADFMKKAFDDLFKQLRPKAEIKILGTP